MIKRGVLKLISSGKVKKKFRHCTVLCDESIWKFNLEEWEVYKDNDWIEFNKRDGTKMQCFYVSNILMIDFAYLEEKGQGTTKSDADLKPVA
jgi:hypothetical protein